MNILPSGLCLLTFIALAWIGQGAEAQTPSTSTTITVPDMSCMGCAKKMATTLREIPGVGQVLANVEAHTMTVRPQPQKLPSARALWEAVEKAGYRPTRLEGPDGTFSTKPKS